MLTDSIIDKYGVKIADTKVLNFIDMLHNSHVLVLRQRWSYYHFT